MEKPFHKWAKRIDPEETSSRPYACRQVLMIVREFLPHYTDFGQYVPLDACPAFTYHIDASYCLDRLIKQES